MEKIFNVEKISSSDPFNGILNIFELKEMTQKTCHSSERENRFDVLSDDEFIDSVFVVDKGHINGKEYHIITESAEDIVVNCVTKKIVTVLFCRQNQIKRLYKAVGARIPRCIMEAAHTNEITGLNLY